MTQRNGLTIRTWIAIITLFVVVISFMGGGVVKAYNTFAPKSIEKEVRNISHNLARLMQDRGLEWEMIVE